MFIESLTLLGMAVIALVAAGYWGWQSGPLGAHRNLLGIIASLLLIAAILLVVGRENADTVDRFGLGLGSELIGAVLALLLLRESGAGKLLWSWWTWIVLFFAVGLIVAVPHLDDDAAGVSLSLGLDVVGAAVVFMAGAGFAASERLHRLTRQLAADDKP